MGAEVFIQHATGANAFEAFDAAVESAAYDLGHSGYTGSIAEKNEFVIIPLPAGVDPEGYADQLIADCDERIDDKWGPAGCFELGNNEYLFFGWASS